MKVKSRTKEFTSFHAKIFVKNHFIMEHSDSLDFLQKSSFFKKKQQKYLFNSFFRHIFAPL